MSFRRKPLGPIVPRFVLVATDGVIDLDGRSLEPALIDDTSRAR